MMMRNATRTMPPQPATPDTASSEASGRTEAAAIGVAVIVPAFRQPGLLPEAILSVLDQIGAPPAAVVVVDDGCPYPATARTALDFAAAHPGRAFVLRQPNGGLSAARNAGIDFALRAFPACRAVHFLDADNRLHPHYLARALAVLDRSPHEVGWVYPDIDERRNCRASRCTRPTTAASA
jgi:glycosyltransferase involved in cell wall biosynthesis